MKNDVYKGIIKDLLETIIVLLLVATFVGVIAHAGSKPRKLVTANLPVISSYEFLNNVEFTEIEDSMVYLGIQVKTLSEYKDAKQHIVVSNTDEPIFDRTKLVSIATDADGNVYYQPMPVNREFRKFDFEN